MASLDELGSLPPVTDEPELFDYVPLDAEDEPPQLELHARLARAYEDDEDGDGLRLAFVAGHPVDSTDLIVLSYLWRSRDDVVVWGVERWESPERRLKPYKNDSSFSARGASAVHADLKRVGAHGFPQYVRDLLGA